MNKFYHFIYHLHTFFFNSRLLVCANPFAKKDLANVYDKKAYINNLYDNYEFLELKNIIGNLISVQKDHPLIRRYNVHDLSVTYVKNLSAAMAPPPIKSPSKENLKISLDQKHSVKEDLLKEIAFLSEEEEEEDEFFDCEEFDVDLFAPAEEKILEFEDLVALQISLFNLERDLRNREALLVQREMALKEKEMQILLATPKKSKKLKSRANSLKDEATTIQRSQSNPSVSALDVATPKKKKRMSKIFNFSSNKL